MKKHRKSRSSSYLSFPLLLSYPFIQFEGDFLTSALQFGAVLGTNF